jgi:sporulation protein YlmC with PRC-barrel domain
MGGRVAHFTPHAQERRIQEMTSKISASAAAIALIIGSSVALAQTTTPPSTTVPKTPTTPPAVKAPPATPSGPLSWYSHDASELRASKLIGTRVINNANETVGNVNEVILAEDGRVAGLVIGVGGFLGIGEHEVAVTFNSVKISRDEKNNLVLAMNATRESLKSAPAWTWKQAKNG